MQFLKGLFWILLAVLLTVFAIGNWGEVAKIHLWGGLVAEVKLPLLVLLCFLIGFLPTLLYQHTVRWRLRQRLINAERTIADLRGVTAAPIVTTEPLPPVDPVEMPPTTTTASPTLPLEQP